MAAPEFHADYATALTQLVVPWQPVLPAPEPGSEPTLLLLNEPLALELGLDPDWLRSPDGVAVLGGRAAPPGSAPVAQAYAGHQFGSFSPVLGDGRAVLLGELRPPGAPDTRAGLLDLALKGSGRTPFARGGDGRAVLGPVLREYLFGEAMHALGIPTTRALAVVTTGDRVWRDGEMPPGAVLTRVAASHLRVGTMELAAASLAPDLRRPSLEALAAYAIERHHPHAHGARGLLDAVTDAQARLVAQWLAVGFVHGVLNTDNTTLSGQTIDYGPCAWIDGYDEDAVFSSIDAGGRYRFGQQPAILQWNLARLAEALLPLLGDSDDEAIAAAREVLDAYPHRFRDHYLARLRAKLGLTGPEQPGDAALVDDLLALLRETRADYVGFWRDLASSLRGAGAVRPEFSGWLVRWRARIASADPREVAAAMDLVNPAYVPRNHLVDEALTAAVGGDLTLFGRLLEAVSSPYAARPGLQPYAAPAPAGFTEAFVTYCGT